MEIGRKVIEKYFYQKLKMSRENQFELNDEERLEFLYHVCIEVTMVAVHSWQIALLS